MWYILAGQPYGMEVVRYMTLWLASIESGKLDDIGWVTSLSLHLPIYKTQVIAPIPLEVLNEDKYKHLAVYLVHSIYAVPFAFFMYVLT